MQNDNTTRVEDEVALLEAMYPEEVKYNSRSKEIFYNHSGASLLVRMSDSYPEGEAPQIISASSAGKGDLRDRLMHAVVSLPVGEEGLDAIFNAFQELLADAESQGATRDNLALDKGAVSSLDETKQTTIIWLHHLVNTKKRKLCLSPADHAVSGLSKPGYPGVLVFSGPALGVNEHVHVLKQQSWAAFQIRYEDESKWSFQHGAGVREVETMGEVVRSVGDRKNDFLEAIRMR